MMMNWKARRVLILGAARQGLALARYLCERGASVVLNDRRSAAELAAAQAELADLPLEWVLGEHPVELLDGIDLVCPSGGVPLTLPLLVAARQRGIPFSNDSQIFLEAAPCRVVGITGSAGKTTTTTLLGRMAAAQAETDPSLRRVWVGGNIGNPLITELDQMAPQDLAVVELSSFQLELMRCAPQVAVILNITPNHLDRHGSMAAYTAAKAQILAHQGAEDIAVLGHDDPGAWSLVPKVRGELFSFGWQRQPEVRSGVFLDGEWISRWQGEAVTPLLSRQQIALRGEHNVLNVLAACAVAQALGFSVQSTQAGAQDFGGVPHRLELVRQWGGARWYNDSIATAPERAMAAIRSFDEPLILLAGGRDKDLPWQEFAELVCRRVDHLILFGEAADLIAQQIAQLPGRPEKLTVETYPTLEPAIRAAARTVQGGEVVLLSPGGTSFDEFVDFAERGECFRKWVNNLP
ncbi:MAG: UDP-N-acetylmuramoyl-L-alanine--D-glutamate ligase [Anaerolineales bacterium]|nr:UDP-N-acetylmuramoyl-L-alanine--D-glutamate ligase [Anaerolineales bacterium]